MNKIEFGKTYDTAAGRCLCTYVEGGIAWMILNPPSRSHRWSIYGAAIDLDSTHDVIWPKESRKVITRTITYPAPETEAPARGKVYYVPEPSRGFSRAWNWEDDEIDRSHLRHGLVYLTEEDTIARAKAMLE